jgi:CcmD family protein
MVKRCLKYFIIFFPLFCSLVLCAQDIPEKSGKVEMADLMRTNGKIYVVVAVCLTILFGLILYVIRLDRKISKLEKERG